MDKPSRLPLETIGTYPNTAAGGGNSGGRPSTPANGSTSDRSNLSPGIIRRMLSLRNLFSSRRRSGTPSPRPMVTSASSTNSSNGGDTNSVVDVGSPAISPKTISAPDVLTQPTPLVKPWTENNYLLVAEIGEGSSSKVYLAYQDGMRDTDPVAIKRVRMTKPGAQRLAEAEIVASSALGRHPHLIHVVSYYFSDDQEHVCLVLPYYECDLLNYLRDSANPISWDTKRQIFSDMLDGLYFMHSNQFAHLDVKLENVVLDLRTPGRPRAALADFGFSKHIAPATALQETWQGSDHYTCPQILLNKPYSATKADAWSAGVCLYALLYIRLPWGNPRKNIVPLLESKFPEQDLCAPHHAIALFTRLLEPDEQSRLSVGEAKMSRWFAD